MPSRRSPWMNQDLDDFRQLARTFCEREIKPNIERFIEQKRVDRELWTRAGELGLLCASIPEEYGGGGGNFFHEAILIEEQARIGDSSWGAALHSGIVAHYLLHYGTEEQKREWLPRLCAGEALGAFGLTEAGGGSDAGSTRTTARLEDGHWVIDGSKAFITNSGTDLTALVTVTAVTGTRPDGGKEISAIIVPSGTSGFAVGQRYSKVGWNASDTRELSFTDVRVPEENLVGQRGRGYAQFLSILDEGRIAISALSVGLAQGCVDESVKYAGEREAFGQAIGRNQAIQFMIADMEVRASTARLAYYRAAEKMLRGEPFKREASIAKLYSSEVAMDNARYATQVHGGYGFMNEFPVGRFYRDAKILEIGEGTSEVQRMLIARDLGLG